MGEFGFGPKDTGEADSGSQEIRSGDLLLASSVGCTSRVGELDWAIEGVGIGGFEAKTVRCGHGKGYRVEGGWGQVEEEGFGESGGPASLRPRGARGELRRVGGNSDFGFGILD